MSEDSERMLALLLVKAYKARELAYWMDHCVPSDGYGDYNKEIAKRGREMYPTKWLIDKYNITEDELKLIGEE